MSNDGEKWHVLTDAEQAPIVIHHLAVDGTTLYGVTQTSAYRLQKHTGTWIQIAPEIPKRVTSLVVAGNILYVGTEHRGVMGLPLQWDYNNAEFIGIRKLNRPLCTHRLLVSCVSL